MHAYVRLLTGTSGSRACPCPTWRWCPMRRAARTPSPECPARAEGRDVSAQLRFAPCVRACAAVLRARARLAQDDAAEVRVGDDASAKARGGHDGAAQHGACGRNRKIRACVSAGWWGARREGQRTAAKAVLERTRQVCAVQVALPQVLCGARGGRAQRSARERARDATSQPGCAVRTRCRALAASAKAAGAPRWSGWRW
jgi:hypothetical protein